LFEVHRQTTLLQKGYKKILKSLKGIIITMPENSMIGCIINFDGDIFVFLAEEQVAELKDKELEGVMFEYNKPTAHAKLLMDIDREPLPALEDVVLMKRPPTRKSKLGIGTHDNRKDEGIYRIYLSPYKYAELSEKGLTGGRGGYIKSDIMTYAQARKWFKKDMDLILSDYELQVHRNSFSRKEYSATL
jgi:hypothetical protein